MREADARSACSKLRGTPTPFQCAIVPAGDISAANFRSEKFGTVSLYKQLSGKLSDLPVTATYDVWERYASPLEAAWRCRLLAHHVIRCAAIFRTLSDNNGQRSARRLNRYAAIDPKRTSATNLSGLFSSPVPTIGLSYASGPFLCPTAYYALFDHLPSADFLRGYIGD